MLDVCAARRIWFVRRGQRGTRRRRTAARLMFMLLVERVSPSGSRRSDRQRPGPHVSQLDREARQAKAR